MSFAENVAAAAAIVDKVYDSVSSIARQYNLAIQTDRKPARSADDWSMVLSLKGTEPEYRIGFNVSLRPGMAGVYVWSLVTDLPTGQWQQYIRENVTLENLEETINAGLDEFEKWLKANDGIDPIEAARKLAGTAYYWSHDRTEDHSEFEATFEDGFYGFIAGDDGDFEADLQDPDGQSIVNITGPDAKELMLKIEAANAARKRG